MGANFKPLAVVSPEIVDVPMVKIHKFVFKNDLIASRVRSCKFTVGCSLAGDLRF